MSSAPVSGGWPARRAVVRWATRLLRREWRQHLLILSLLTVAVAGAIGFSCAVHNLAAGDGREEFGDANHTFLLVDPDRATLPAELDRATEWFGAIDAIGHRSVAVPGSVEELDLRAQDPDGPFGESLLDLRAGRYPATADEVAVTEGAAELLGTNIGGAVSLDGQERHVVGLVENPSDLSRDFVLVPPSELMTSDSVSILADASEDRADDYRWPDSVREASSRGEVAENVVAAVIALVAGTLALFLVALIAAASFTVIAQRRLPQLGMLAAVGASEKHLRLSMIASGAATGIVAALLGAGLGLIGWLAIAPRMEGAVDYRIDPYNIPWWLVFAGMVLAVGAATAAAWWPGRTMSRMPPVLSLSGRPPKPAALHRSAVLAIGVLVVSLTCLYVAGRNIGDRGESGGDMVLLGVGTVGLVAGVLLVSPITVRTLARAARHVPIGPRVALRDLGRYQARSGAAVAAIALALGIPVTIVAATAAAANDSGPGNLAADQLRVRPPQLDGLFVPEQAELVAMQEGVDAIASTLSDPSVIRLDVALDPDMVRDPRLPGIEPIMLGRPLGDEDWNIVSPVYVATPDVLDVLGLRRGDVATIDGIVTSADGELEIIDAPPGGPKGTRRGDMEHVATPGTLDTTYTALPQALIAAESARERGWDVVPSGDWIIETPRPLTNGELSRVRDVAAGHDLALETRDVDTGLEGLRFGAVTVGLLLALGIVAMTVGLLRVESFGELRTLSATGASSATRRSITATTAAALAALGAGLGIAGAYLGLSVGQVANLLPLPALDLIAIAVGLPLAAAAAGWAFAGREPRGLARQPIE